MAIVSKGGSITYSSNEQGNQAHSAYDGKFVSKDGKGGSDKAETTSFDRARNPEELKDLSVEETLDVAVEAGMIDSSILANVQEDKNEITSNICFKKLAHIFLCL